MIRNLFRILLMVLLFSAILPCLFSQGTESDRIRIMFYNVENFFDIKDDSLNNDEDFLPDGVMRWNYSRYNKKYNSLYKTIVSAGEWNIPDIIAFCEVENRKILQDLLFNTYLSKCEFGIVHEESSDLRGIDVCLIYNKKSIELLGYRYLIPENIKEFHTRSVLYSCFLVNTDTIHLFVNHWPSRRGGSLAGEDLRISIATMVHEVCDSVFRVTSGMAKIIICGDFNSTPGDIEIETLLNSDFSSSKLINLAENLAAKGEGSYRYKGIWEMIDQVIVSESLINNESGLGTAINYFRIFKPGFLLEKDPLYPGSSPFSTYRGYRYHGGYSDHLPVLLDLITK